MTKQKKNKKVGEREVVKETTEAEPVEDVPCTESELQRQEKVRTRY